MKKLFTILAAVLLTANVFAQSPEKMSYQALVRNSSNALVTNTQVGMRISILQGSPTGTVAYTEAQTPTTNANGLVSIEIGGGTGFSTINWANGPYFTKIETDPTGGTNYTITGTSQLLSVPYALHAKTAETVTGGITESDPIYSNSQAANITATDITNLGNLSGVNTGDQDLSGFATNTALGDSTAQVRSEIPDVSGFLTTETDPVFTSWDKSTGIAITESQISDLGNYLESETDPVFTSWDKSTGIAITESQISDLGNYIETETQNLNDVLTQNNSAGNQNITNLANPVNAQDAATKAYVDALLARIEALEESDLLHNCFTDYRDGNHYNVVKIGNQTWMAENLKYLPSVVGPGTGSNTEPYYYVYGYDGTNVNAAKATTNYQTYGVLYNWPAAMNGSTSSASNPSGVQGVCPTGWHLPSDAEWTQMENYLADNGYNYDGTTGGGRGKIAKALASTTGWQSSSDDGAVGNNPSTNNESGFTALPGGYRNGPFNAIGNHGTWWSATAGKPDYALTRGLDYDFSDVVRGDGYEEFGCSVRCLRD